jgi:hypothetical protein
VIGQDYTVRGARYAKGMLLVRVRSESGLKSRAARLLGALKCRWTNREGGYICSPTKFAKFERLFSEGRDASFFGELEPPS